MATTSTKKHMVAKEYKLLSTLAKALNYDWSFTEEDCRVRLEVKQLMRCTLDPTGHTKDLVTRVKVDGLWCQGSGEVSLIAAANMEDHGQDCLQTIQNRR